MASSKSLIPAERIEHVILVIRDQNVLLDADLAELYEVQTKVLVQAVKRNADRFPSDFMFRLTKQEFANLRSQSVTSSSWGGRRTPPMAFTEQGVAMLSSVLRSKRAVQVNIEIMRAFVRLRGILTRQESFGRKLAQLERKFEHHDKQINVIFDAIRQLLEPPLKKRRDIGFTK